MFEVAEWSADGSVRRLGCFADDGSPASREEVLAAVGPLQPLDEFMAEMCPAGSPERAALPDFWLVRLLQLGERRAAAQAAERMELVALLAAERPATDDVPTGRAGAPGPDARRERVPEVMHVSEWLPAELALVHPYGDRRAAELARISLTLTRRFPATLGLLRRGEIDEARARVVADLLGPLEDEVAGRVEVLVLPRAGTQTPTNLAAGIRRAIDRVDAAARRRRHEQARADAEVRWWATQEGMARLAADLDLPVAAACGRRIDLLARQLRDGGDDRPMGRLRAEVLADLVLRPWAERPSVTAQLVVHASLPTLRGGDEPAEVDGHPVSAEQCRELLAELDALGLERPTGGTLEVAVHDGTGRLVAVGTRRALARGARGRGLRRPPATPRYRPTAEQRRLVQVRDRRCRHPHCTRPVGRTDIDHGRSWPEGHTDCDNLCCLCRRHHRLKTHARGWRFVLLPGGELQVTTPSGITRTTTPPQVPPETPVPSGAPPGIGEPLTAGPGDPGFIGPWPF